MTTKTIPIVYALAECPACNALREAWAQQGIEHEVRLVDESQELMEEARKFGDIVPIIVYPDGAVDNSGSYGGKFG
jgi:glutaredoxin